MDKKKVLIVSATYYEDICKDLEMWAARHLDNAGIKNKIFQMHLYAGDEPHP